MWPGQLRLVPEQVEINNSQWTTVVARIKENMMIYRFIWLNRLSNQNSNQSYQNTEHQCGSSGFILWFLTANTQTGGIGETWQQRFCCFMRWHLTHFRQFTKSNTSDTGFIAVGTGNVFGFDWNECWITLGRIERNNLICINPGKSFVFKSLTKVFPFE